ncbi:MAG: phosphatidate cytidylyltransferase [Bacteroidales bacterium]
MKTFIKRTLFGAIYAIVVFCSIFLGPFAFGLLVFVFLIFSLKEYQNFLNKADIHLKTFWFYASNILLYLFGFLASSYGWPLKYYIFPVIIVYIPFVFQVLLKNSRPFHETGQYLVSHFYLAVPLSLLSYLFQLGVKAGYWINFAVFGFFLLIWVNDSFAYIVGSVFGKHKLNRIVSPNKTWEGSIGGLVFTLLGSYLLYLIFPEQGLFEWLGFALIIVIFGTFGDLFESVAKRGIMIKESGNILPGHGGMLDRLDSLLIASPFVFVYFLIIMN